MLLRSGFSIIRCSLDPNVPRILVRTKATAVAAEWCLKAALWLVVIISVCNTTNQRAAIKDHSAANSLLFDLTSILAAYTAVVRKMGHVEKWVTQHLPGPCMAKDKIPCMAQLTWPKLKKSVQVCFQMGISNWNWHDSSLWISSSEGQITCCQIIFYKFSL